MCFCPISFPSFGSIGIDFFYRLNVPDNRLAKERSDFAGQSSSGGYVVLCAALPLNLFRGTSLKPGSMSKHFLMASIKASCSKGSGLTSVP
jgi:hypothetical protein